MAASLRRCTRAVNRSDSAFQKLVVLHALVWAISLLLVSRPSAAPHGGPAMVPNGAQFPNPAGASRTISTSGQVALTGPFFETIGTNGRACVTCHQPGDGMSISAASVQERFDRTAGMDPIFRVVDGSNCNDGVDVSTLAGRRAAYTLLRTRGLIRVAVGVPTNADFTVTNVENPYGCGDTQSISQYRRPLPATNLRFLSAVMWDGRESFGPGRRITFASSREGTLIQDLLAQSFDATTGHAEGAGIRPTAAERRQIVDFELSLYTAQSTVQRGGALGSAGAMGGPVPLAAERFFISINSSVQSLFNLFGLDIGPEFPGGLTEPADSTATTGDGQFTTDVFHLYDAWLSLPSSSPRAAIARGERLFNSAPMTIAGVAGFNDDAANGGLVAGGVPAGRGHVRDLSRHAERGQPLVPDAAQHRRWRLRSERFDEKLWRPRHQLPAQDHSLQEGFGVYLRRDDRPRTGAHHRQVRRHRQDERAGPSRPRGAGAVLSQRVGEDAARRRPFLREEVQHDVDGVG
jgi:hypothetical protein